MAARQQEQEADGMFTPKVSLAINVALVCLGVVCALWGSLAPGKTLDQGLQDHALDRRGLRLPLRRRLLLLRPALGEDEAAGLGRRVRRRAAICFHFHPQVEQVVACS